jgi:26S proteasome regulatory subunit T5
MADVEESSFLAEVGTLSNDEIRQRIRALDNEIRIMKSDIGSIRHESKQQLDHVKDNKEKIKVNKQLPYLVANVVEIVEPYDDKDNTSGGNVDLSLTPEGKGCVVKTSTRQTVFLPIPGLVRIEELKPNEIVGEISCFIGFLRFSYMMLSPFLFFPSTLQE